jgi:hypothetical protein
VVSRRSVVTLATLAAACGPILGGPRHQHLAVSPTIRQALLRRAQVWRPTDVASMDLKAGPAGPGVFAPGASVTCDYVHKSLPGHSPKFECRIAPDDDVKVKYGRDNGEVYGEVAATRLFWALGFGADHMYPVRVLCRGCPSHLHADAAADGDARVFEVAAIERKMPGRELVTDRIAGWAWPELNDVDEEHGGAPKAQRDALMLLAVFVQHTDSKPEQQRLLCEDESGKEKTGKKEKSGKKDKHAKQKSGQEKDGQEKDGDEKKEKQEKRERLAAACEHPFLMVNDLGLTFGRANLLNRSAVGAVNLELWRTTPIWASEKSCEANLKKSASGTLENPIISEAGRRFLSDLLARLSDRQLRDLFEAARFDLRPRDPADPRSAPARIDEWIDAFRAKRDEIAAKRCPA